MRARLQRVLDRGARAIPSGRGTALLPAGQHVLYGNVISTLDLADAKTRTDDLVRAIGQPAGTQAYVTGAPAIQHDLDPIFNRDLAKGESIALPIALVVLLLVFGLSWAVLIPFLFAASTVLGTLSLVYVIAHFITMPTYVTNLIYLIGLGIAIDYSLLIVYRFREELAHGLEVEAAIVRTMQTAGRAVVFSGATVAIGLALLIFMPLPFIRAIGIGGFLLPVVSLLAAARSNRHCSRSSGGAACTASRGRVPPRSAAAAGARRRPAGRRRAPLLGAHGALDHAAEVALRARDRGAAPRPRRAASPGSS